MNSLERELQNLEIDEHVSVKSIIHNCTFTPKTEQQKNKILQGDFPENFSLFLHYLSVRGDSDLKLVPDSIRWYKDKTAPFLTFQVTEFP